MNTGVHMFCDTQELHTDSLQCLLLLRTGEEDNSLHFGHLCLENISLQEQNQVRTFEKASHFVNTSNYTFFYEFKSSIEDIPSACRIKQLSKLNLVLAHEQSADT